MNIAQDVNSLKSECSQTEIAWNEPLLQSGYLCTTKRCPSQQVIPSCIKCDTMFQQFILCQTFLEAAGLSCNHFYRCLIFKKPQVIICRQPKWLNLPSRFFFAIYFNENLHLNRWTFFLCAWGDTVLWHACFSGCNGEEETYFSGSGCNRTLRWCPWGQWGPRKLPLRCRWSPPLGEILRRATKRNVPLQLVLQTSQNVH